MFCLCWLAIGTLVIKFLYSVGCELYVAAVKYDWFKASCIISAGI